jgi:large subunit ribosomal protein L22
MTGPKTNERPGTRSVVRHARVSAYKAREILDLIRGESYGRASEILTFSERRVSDVIGKCLDSAVANAEHNDGIPAEELFVAACYADEGPTLKRWRPRARGRATRIRKRTCHITIIVARYTPEQLEALSEREGSRGASVAAAEARRQRVARSRKREEDREAAAHDHDHDDEADGSAEDDAVDVEAQAQELAKELVEDRVTEERKATLAEIDDIEVNLDDDTADAEATDEGAADVGEATDEGVTDGDDTDDAEGETDDGRSASGGEDEVK